MPTVTKSIRIDAPRAAVWQRLSSLDRLAGHHPRVTGARFTSNTTQGPGAELRCELGDAGGFTQRVASWDEGRGLTLDVVDAQGLPVKDAHVAFRLEDAGEGCVVGGAVTFRAPLGGLLARSRVAKELLVLDALKASLEENVRAGPTTGTTSSAQAVAAPVVPVAKAPRRAPAKPNARAARASRAPAAKPRTAAKGAKAKPAASRRPIRRTSTRRT